MPAANNGSSAGIGQPIQVNVLNSNTWIQENQILPTSQPFIRAIFNPYETDPDKIQVAEKTIITSAEIEGKTKISRKGKIDIVDPEGLWPARLTNVGIVSNHFTGLRYPNIKIEFGWINIFTPGGRSSKVIESLEGLITKVEFDVTAEGITKATIYFIETITEILSTTRILDPDDIKIFYDEKFIFDAMSVSQKLTYLFNPNKFSYAKQIQDNGIVLEFGDTQDDENVKIELDWGDFIIDKINELTAKAKRPNDKDKKEKNHTDAVYERISAPIYLGKLPPKEGVEIPQYKIIYNWVETPDENATYEQKKDLWSTIKMGPTLFWKKAFNPKEGKKIIEWSSDLSSHGYLIHQAQDELTKKLTEFAEEDWKVVSKQIREKGEDYIKVRRGFLESGKHYDNRVNAVESFKEIEESITEKSTSAANNQLRAILMQNVFKATTRIMGDPFFGTHEDGEPYKIQFKVEFGIPIDGTNESGEFPSLFTRNWMLTNVKHFFEEGSYITELQLLAYPDPGYDKRQKVQEVIDSWEAAGYTPPQIAKDRLYKI